jgi:LacI family transcriptional regulator
MPTTQRRSRRTHTRARLTDVARSARVSTATVSRVLNGADHVSHEVRARVEEAVTHLDYLPNSFAKALACQRSRTVGVIVPSLRNSIFAPGVEAIQQRAARDGYTVLVACSDYDLDQEYAQARTLAARGVDGLILVGRLHHPDLKAYLDGRGVPYVCQSAYERNGPHECVGFDNSKAIGLAVAHLVGLGHTRFAAISGRSSGNDRVTDRIAGVRAALGQAGLRLPPDSLIECDYDIGQSRTAMARILSLRPRPTAVVCINDVLAMGAMLECLAGGVRVPRDVSITGFDDYEFGEHMQPGLTTVRVPTSLMGVGALEHLFDRIGGGARKPSREITVELVVRQSTSPPPRSEPAGEENQ